MSKSTRNSGKPWSEARVGRLRALAKGNTPPRVIELKLGRSENAIRAKASEGRTSLKPTNESSYNRRRR